MACWYRAYIQTVEQRRFHAHQQPYGELHRLSCIHPPLRCAGTIQFSPVSDMSNPSPENIQGLDHAILFQKRRTGRYKAYPSIKADRGRVAFRRAIAADALSDNDHGQMLSVDRIGFMVAFKIAILVANPESGPHDMWRFVSDCQFIRFWRLAPVGGEGRTSDH